MRSYGMGDFRAEVQERRIRAEAAKRASEADWLARHPGHPRKNSRPLCTQCGKRIAAYLGGTGQAYCRKCSSSR